jgi:hypothetical protein
MDLATSHLQHLLPIEQFPLLQGHYYDSSQNLFQPCAKALHRGDVWLGKPTKYPSISEIWECYCPKHQYTKKDLGGSWMGNFNPWVCHYCGRRMLLVHARLSLPYYPPFLKKDE